MNEIPREYFRTFVLAGRAHFVATCDETQHSVHYFVRQSSRNIYHIFVWENNEWCKIGYYYSNTCTLYLYTNSMLYTNATKAVFRFSRPAKWLHLYHKNKCPRCGKLIKPGHGIFGFGKDCWKQIFKQGEYEI